VLRGGSWINNDPANLRAANRNHNDPGNRNDNIGFRVVVVGGAFRKAATLQDSARCRMGNAPVRPEPRSQPNLPEHAPRPRGKDAARAVAGNGRSFGSGVRESHGPLLGRSAGGLTRSMWNRRKGSESSWRFVRAKLLRLGPAALRLRPALHLLEPAAGHASEFVEFLRGGSWINDHPDNLRASNRNHNHPGNRNNNGGFRVVSVGAVSPKAET
jgi:hypothetical protein